MKQHSNTWINAALLGACMVPAVALASAAVAAPYDPLRHGYIEYIDPGIIDDEPPAWQPARRPRRNPAAQPKPKPPKQMQSKKEESAKPPRGPLQIIVSISDQSMTVYGSNGLISRTPVSTGTRTHPTPTGVFSIMQKNRYHRSNIYSNAPMPYMQRITWSGVALHEGALPGYPASHGCIRMPGQFARQLWGITRIGARVIVAHHPTAPIEFKHALLTPLPAVASETTTEITRVADASVIGAERGTDAASEPAMPVEIPALDLPARQDVPTLDAPVMLRDATSTARLSGPVSVFISRKEGRVYVRQSNTPVFDAPVTIERPDVPLGTHVFTAIEAGDDGLPIRWTAVSMPGEPSGRIDRIATDEKSSARSRRSLDVSSDLGAQTAAAALDRIVMPKFARERIANLLSAGSSFIVSDVGLGETAPGTDFVILTR